MAILAILKKLLLYIKTHPPQERAFPFPLAGVLYSKPTSADYSRLSLFCRIYFVPKKNPALTAAVNAHIISVIICTCTGSLK